VCAVAITSLSLSQTNVSAIAYNICHRSMFLRGRLLGFLLQQGPVTQLKHGPPCQIIVACQWRIGSSAGLHMSLAFVFLHHSDEIASSQSTPISCDLFCIAGLPRRGGNTLLPSRVNQRQVSHERQVTYVNDEIGSLR
jgi:hypothetical protein